MLILLLVEGASLEASKYGHEGVYRLKVVLSKPIKDDFDRLKRVESTENAETTSLQDNRYESTASANGSSTRTATAPPSTPPASPPPSPKAAPAHRPRQPSRTSWGTCSSGAEIDGVFRFHLMDAQGSVRDVVDDSGAVIRSMEFQEHGLPISSSGSGSFSPKTYQGGLSVNDDTNDSGFYLMGHRHFASDLGRFISEDPIGFSGGLNLYNGAGTNPVSYVDPEGTDTWIRYVSGYVAKYSPENWSLAVDALNKAKPNTIDTVDFFGHSNSSSCFPGTFDPDTYIDSQFTDEGNGGIKYSEEGSGLRIFWQDRKGFERSLPLRNVLGGKGIRKIRYFGCNTAGGDTPETKTRNNIANYTALVLKGTVVQGSLGDYQYGIDSKGQHDFTDVININMETYGY